LDADVDTPCGGASVVQKIAAKARLDVTVGRELVENSVRDYGDASQTTNAGKAIQKSENGGMKVC
jgi:hypothetical protein